VRAERHVLGAKLQNGCAAAEKGGGQIENRPAGARRGIGVEDRVEGRECRMPYS
jgi:hypothetical protein